MSPFDAAPEIEIENVNNQLPMLNHWLSELNPGQVSMIPMNLMGGTQVSTSEDFSYSFSTAGTYTVDVTVTDSLGETYTSSITITINNNPTVAVDSSQNPTDAGNSVTFTSPESGGTGTISYEWYINGNSEGSGSSLSYSFPSSGTYNVSVVVTDSDGHTATSYVIETVYSDPSVSISSSQNPTDVGNSIKRIIYIRYTVIL